MKLTRMLAAASVLAAIAVAAPASATVIGFDDITIPQGSVFVPLTTYGGLTWSNVYVEYGIGGGYSTGVVSQPNAAFNYAGALGSFSSSDPFTLTSATFTSQLHNENLKVTGYVNGVATYTTSFAINPNAPVLETFNWAGVTSVSLVEANGGGLASSWVMDNLTFTKSVAAVPEPASWGLMIGGLGLVGGAMRRRRRQPAFA